MDEQQVQKPVPKKYCMISLMFPVTDDKVAMNIKAVLDEYVKDFPEKRYRFEITDN